MKPLLLALILTSASCSFSQQPYSELADYGFTGNVKTIVTKDYRDPVETSGTWHASTQPSLIKTATFDHNGMLAEESFKSERVAYTRTYKNNGDKKISCIESGDRTTVSKYNYSGSTMIERNYDADSVLQFQATTYFDKNKLTIKEVYQYFNSHGHVSQSNTTVFVNRIDGYFNKIIFTDDNPKSTSETEYIVVARDATGNPTTILKKQDGQVQTLKVVMIEYRETEGAK